MWDPNFLSVSSINRRHSQVDDLYGRHKTAASTLCAILQLILLDLYCTAVIWASYLNSNQNKSLEHVPISPETTYIVPMVVSQSEDQTVQNCAGIRQTTPW